MKPEVSKSARHFSLMMGFKFTSWLLVVIATMSIAVIIDWYLEKADHPKPISFALYAAGCASIIINFVLIQLAFDGLQRSIVPDAKFATTSSLLILACLLVVETLQVYFFHAVSQPDHRHTYGNSHEFTDWLHWAVTAFAGPLIKAGLVCVYTRFATSQEHYIKAHLTVDAQ